MVSAVDLLHFRGLVQTVPCPGCLRTALPTCASFFETLRESTFPFVDIFKVLESLAQRPPLSITRSGTSPSAASLVDAPIGREWRAKSRDCTPDCTMTSRNAHKACQCHHTVTTLSDMFDDNSALSGKVMPDAIISTVNKTAPPPLPTAERVPVTSSRVRMVMYPFGLGRLCTFST